MWGSHALPISMIKHQREFLRGVWVDRRLRWPAGSQTSCFLISIVDTRGYLWDPSSRSMGLHSQAPSILKQPGVVNTRHKGQPWRRQEVWQVSLRGGLQPQRKELVLGTQPGIWLEKSLLSVGQHWAWGWWGFLKPASPSPELQRMGPSPIQLCPHTSCVCSRQVRLAVFHRWLWLHLTASIQKRASWFLLPKPSFQHILGPYPICGGCINE